MTPGGEIACPFARSSFGVGGNPVGLVAADFDEDGILDVAVVNEQTNDVSVLLGNGSTGLGDGTFATAVSYSVPSAPQDIGTADVNSDGVLDLVGVSMHSVYVLLGNGVGGVGDGTFGVATSVAGTSMSSALVIEDFDADGIFDLAVANSNFVQIYRGQGSGGMGNGSFSFWSSTFLSSQVRRLAVGEFNADGIQDIAVTQVGGVGGVAILLGNANGTFGLWNNYPFGDMDDVATGDFNEDGATDLAVSRYLSAAVWILIGVTNQGVPNGNFQPTTTLPVSNGSREIGVLDLDYDAISDLVVACEFGNSVDVLLGRGSGGAGDGTFAPAQAFAVGGGPHALVFGDFLEDEIPDVVVTNVNAGTVSRLAGTCQAPWNAIQVVSPNGGETFYVDQLASISWTKGDSVMATNVEISRNGGLDWETIANDVNGTSFDWMVTGPVTSVAGVRVTNVAFPWTHDSSDGNFAILSAPPCDTLPPNASWTGCGTNAGPATPNLPNLASDGVGGVFVAWGPLFAFAPLDFRVNRVTAEGSIAPGWPADGVLVATDSNFTCDALIPDGSGGVFAAWSGRRNGIYQTRAQHYTAAGTLASGWAAGGMIVPDLQATFNGSRNFAATSDGAGGLYVAGQDRVQRLDATGNVVTGWPVEFPGSAIDWILEDGAGGVLVMLAGPFAVVRVAASGAILWQTSFNHAFASFPVADGAGGVYVVFEHGMTRFRSDGVEVAGWPVFFSQEVVRHADSDRSGGLLVYLKTATSSVLQRYTPDGQPLWGAGNGVPIGDATQMTHFESVAPDGVGGAVSVWRSRPPATPNQSIWATRVSANGSIAPGWPAQGVELCYLGGGGITGQDSGTWVSDCAGGTYAAWWRRTAPSPSAAGTVQVFRFGTEPPSINSAPVSTGSPSTAVLGTATVTFDAVTTAGQLYLEVTTGPEPPAGLQTVPDLAPAVYELATSAVYNGGVDVCIDYDPADVVGDESALQLLHYEESSWVDITTSVDVNANRICGRTTTLSPFAIVEPAGATDVPAPAASFRLYQNEPNPFNPTTTIAYEIPARGRIQLSVFDIRGRLVRTLVDRLEDAGRHQVIWSGDDQHGIRVASGVYFYRLETPQRTLTRRMVLMK